MTEYIAPSRIAETANLPRAPSLASKMVGSRSSSLARGRKGSAAKINSDDERDSILPRQSTDTISAIRPQPHTSSATYPRTGFDGNATSKGGDCLDGHVPSPRKRRDRSGSWSRSRSRGAMGSKATGTNHQERPKLDMEVPPPITFVQPVLVSPVPSYVHPPRFPCGNIEAKPPSQFQNPTTPSCNTMDDIIERPKRPLPSRRMFASTTLGAPAPLTSVSEVPTLSRGNTGGVESLVDGSVRGEPPSPLVPVLHAAGTPLRRPSLVASVIAVDGGCSKLSPTSDLDKPSPSPSSPPQDDTSPVILASKTSLGAESSATADGPSTRRVRPRPQLPSVSDHRHGMFLDHVLSVLSRRKASSPSPTSTQGFQLSAVEGSPITPHNDKVSNYPFAPSARQPTGSYLFRPLQQGDSHNSTLTHNIKPMADSRSTFQRRSVTDGYSSDDVVVYMAPGAKDKRATSNPRERSRSWIGITEGNNLYALGSRNCDSN